MKQRNNMKRHSPMPPNVNQ